MGSPCHMPSVHKSFEQICTDRDQSRPTSCDSLWVRLLQISEQPLVDPQPSAAPFFDAYAVRAEILQEFIPIHQANRGNGPVVGRSNRSSREARCPDEQPVACALSQHRASEFIYKPALDNPVVLLDLYEHKRACNAS